MVVTFCRNVVALICVSLEQCVLRGNPVEDILGMGDDLAVDKREPRQELRIGALW